MYNKRLLLAASLASLITSQTAEAIAEPPSIPTPHDPYCNCEDCRFKRATPRQLQRGAEAYLKQKRYSFVSMTKDTPKGHGTHLVNPRRAERPKGKAAIRAAKKARREERT